MSTDKPLIANSSQIYRHRPERFRDEPQNLFRLDNQAFIFDFEHHFKTTSIDFILK